MNDMWDSMVTRDDNFALISEMNREVDLFVKTPAISQIFGILNEISFGYNFIEIGMIMRESVLLSKILLSAESWHKLFQYQIEKLEEVDKIFYRKLFNSHAKTGEEFSSVKLGPSQSN